MITNRFCNHAFDFRPNCTPLSAITIINITTVTNCVKTISYLVFSCAHNRRPPVRVVSCWGATVFNCFTRELAPVTAMFSVKLFQISDNSSCWRICRKHVCKNHFGLVSSLNVNPLFSSWVQSSVNGIKNVFIAGFPLPNQSPLRRTFFSRRCGGSSLITL